MKHSTAENSIEMQQQQYTETMLSGSAEASAQLTIAMLPVIFSDSAIALIQAVIPALTNMRDRGEVLIDPSVIRKYMAYAQCCTLLTEPSVSPKSKTAVRSFIESRAGFKDKVEFDKQPEEVRKDFSFAQAYFIRSLSAFDT
jgi:intracellular multiplication protein IcmO